MLFYRVEDKNCLGPYHSKEEEVEDLLAPHQNVWDECHPRPCEEKEFFCRAVMPHMICAFATREQLDAWFPSNELAVLRRYGYEVKQIEVSEVVVITRYQAVVVRAT